MLYLSQNLNFTVVLFLFAIFAISAWIGAYANNHTKLLKTARAIASFLIVAAFIQIHSDLNFVDAFTISNVDSIKPEAQYEDSKIGFLLSAISRIWEMAKAIL